MLKMNEPVNEANGIVSVLLPFDRVNPPVAKAKLFIGVPNDHQIRSGSDTFRLLSLAPSLSVIVNVPLKMFAVSEAAAAVE